MTVFQAIASAPRPLRAAFRACRKHIVAVVAFSAFINLLYLTPTLYMMQVYDRVIPTNGLVTLAWISLVALTAFVTLSMLEWLRSRILVRMSARMDQELATQVMAASFSTRDIPRNERAQAMRELDALRQSLTGAGILALIDTPWCLVYILFAFLLSPLLGMLTTAASILLLALAWLNERHTSPVLRQANATASVTYARQDQITGWSAEARAMGMVPGLVEKHSRERASLLRDQTDASFLAGGYSGVMRFIRLTLQSAALALGAYLALQQMISTGAVIAASFLLTRALAPIEQIVGAWRSLVQAGQSYERMSRLLAGADSAPRMALPPPQGEIGIEDLTVSVGGRRAPALVGISCTMPAGKIIALIGPSGSGKSTLLKAIVGCVEMQSGTIRLDGSSLADWDPQALTQHIGYLPQDFPLFPGTIKDNISRFQSYSDEFVSNLDVRILQAARLALAHEMIQKLPDGYDTLIGVGGLGLSSGQSQKIALARAFFDEPQVLLLDEPNAHLDAASDRQLNAALHNQRSRGRTVVMAAHHGAALQLADFVILLRDGKIEQSGTLQEITAHLRASSAASLRVAEPGPSGDRRSA